MRPHDASVAGLCAHTCDTHITAVDPPRGPRRSPASVQV